MIISWRFDVFRLQKISSLIKLCIVQGSGSQSRQADEAKLVVWQTPRVPSQTSSSHLALDFSHRPTSSQMTISCTYYNKIAIKVKIHKITVKLHLFEEPSLTLRSWEVHKHCSKITITAAMPEKLLGLFPAPPVTLCAGEAVTLNWRVERND